MGDISYRPLIEDMTWSYSRLKAFDDCPYRWYLRYIRYPNANRKNTFFANYGKFLHELIASFYSGEKTPAELQTEYLRDFKAKVNALAPNKTVFSNYFLDGLNYLKVITPPKNKVISVESKVEFMVDEIPFVGYVDLVEEDEQGNIIVVDNKSRTLKPRSTRATPTKADLELDQYLRQLYIYSIPVQEEYGRQPSSLCFNCFRSQTRIVEPFRHTGYDDAVLWAKKRISEIAAETEFRPNIEYFKCRYLCEMQEYCDYYALSRG